MVECTGLENQRRLIAVREFESLLLRHYSKNQSRNRLVFFRLSVFSLIYVVVILVHGSNEKALAEIPQQGLLVYSDYTMQK